jgi:glycosyltransferase involved in cell wall biosynthesis
VHDHTLIGPVYAERFEGLGVVTTNHGPFQSELGDLYRAIADQVPIIAISHHQAGTAPEIPVAAVIHHGVDTSRFPVGGGNGGYAAFLGRMCPEKGVSAAIRVARLAGVPLRIAAKMSEPAERAYFEAEVRPLLGGDVEYLGELDAYEKAELLGGTFCLLNPIAWPEPFGMVMVEALACGTPVVATPMGAAPEIVDDGATGFIRAGEEALARAVLAAPGLDRALCREAACTKFSAERMVAEHLAVYRSVLERVAVPAAA